MLLAIYYGCSTLFLFYLLDEVTVVVLCVRRCLSVTSLADTYLVFMPGVRQYRVSCRLLLICSVRPVAREGVRGGFDRTPSVWLLRCTRELN